MAKLRKVEQFAEKLGSWELTLKRGVCHVKIIEQISTTEDRLPARVFISCGQDKGTDEVQVARDIAAEFRKLGFDPYVAVEEQTLRGNQREYISSA